MAMQQLVTLYNTLPDLSVNLAEHLGSGKVAPVIGEGNCAFRSIIQSLLLGACATPEKKEQLIEYLRTVYFVNKDAVEAEHRAHRASRDISFDAFVRFVDAFRHAEVSDGSFEQFFRAYFPHEVNMDGTPKVPANDGVIKFIACCLRKDVVNHQVAAGQAQASEDILEDRFFSINPSVVNYFQAKNIDLILYESVDIPEINVLTTGAETGKPLLARIVFHQEQAVGNNGHYSVAFTQVMLDTLGPQQAAEELNSNHVHDMDADYALALAVDQEFKQISEDADYALALELDQKFKQISENADYALALELDQQLNQLAYRQNTLMLTAFNKFAANTTVSFSKPPIYAHQPYRLHARSTFSAII